MYQYIGAGDAAEAQVLDSTLLQLHVSVTQLTVWTKHLLYGALHLGEKVDELDVSRKEQSPSGNWTQVELGVEEVKLNKWAERGRKGKGRFKKLKRHLSLLHLLQSIECFKHHFGLISNVPLRLNYENLFYLLIRHEMAFNLAIIFLFSNQFGHWLLQSHYFKASLRKRLKSNLHLITGSSVYVHTHTQINLWNFIFSSDNLPEGPLW